ECRPAVRRRRHVAQPGPDGAGRLLPELAGQAAQGQVLPRHGPAAAAGRRLPARRVGRPRPGPGPRAGGAVHAAAGRRDAARLVRAGGAAPGRPGQHRPVVAARLPGGELVPRCRVRRRPLPGQRLLGRRAGRPAAARRLPLLAEPARAGAAAHRGRLRPGPAGRRRGGHRPVPGPRGPDLAELLQVQQLQLPRRDHGHRRAAADLADVGGCARAGRRPGAVVRRAAADRAARRGPGPGSRPGRGAAALGPGGRRRKRHHRHRRRRRRHAAGPPGRRRQVQGPADLRPGPGRAPRHRAGRAAAGSRR
ncbi:MAG: TOMM biosynthesis dehydrogenase (protein B), partial [uncultured Corynebacteriales bacterium]